MQVDASICADTNISEKERGHGEETSKPFTSKLKPYLVKFVSNYPQKRKK